VVSMAFLFRGEDKHIEILKTLSKELKIPTKHKVLLFIVEKHQTVVGEREEYYRKMNKYSHELKTLKAAIQGTYDSEKHLKELVGVENEKVVTDRD